LSWFEVMLKTIQSSGHQFFLSTDFADPVLKKIKI